MTRSIMRGHGKTIREARLNGKKSREFAPDIPMGRDDELIQYFTDNQLNHLTIYKWAVIGVIGGYKYGFSLEDYGLNSTMPDGRRIIVTRKHKAATRKIPVREDGQMDYIW